MVKKEKRLKQYAILGYVDNDESRPNTEIVCYIDAKNNQDALKQARAKVKQYSKPQTDIEGEFEYTLSSLVEIKELKSLY